MSTACHSQSCTSIHYGLASYRAILPWLTWGKFDFIVNVTLSGMFAFSRGEKVKSIDILFVITVRRMNWVCIISAYILLGRVPVNKSKYFTRSTIHILSILKLYLVLILKYQKSNLSVFRHVQNWMPNREWVLVHLGLERHSMESP